MGPVSGNGDWLSRALHVVARWYGYYPEQGTHRSVKHLRHRLSQGPGWVLGINGGSHGAGVALVRIEGGEGSLILNAEEERWSRRKHEWGFPTHALDAALTTLASYGAGPEAIQVVACGWDFAAFAGSFLREIVSGLPSSLGLLRDTGLLDLDVIRTLPRRLARRLGRRDTAVLTVPHHDAHAWGSLLLSPFHGEGEAVLVLVADGMGDAASLSVYLAREGQVPERIATNGSLFDSLGLMYQVLSSTQGGWAPLSSEGRYMGAAAWGWKDRAANPFYARLRPLLSLEPEGRLRLNRRWMRWHRTPKNPYGAPLCGVLGPPLQASQLWNPDAVLDPDRTDLPALTRERLDKAAAVQLLFEDGLAHVLDHWLAATGARRLVWTGGTALNCVASLHLMERYADRGLQLWVPPFPGDNGIAAGAAMRLAWTTGRMQRVRPLQHAFLGGAAITTAAIRDALRGAPVRVYQVAGEHLGDHLAQRISDGAFVGLAQGPAETGPRALGHRSILADPTRGDALERMNVHVKRRERVRPLAPVVSAETARALFEFPPGSEHHDLAAWRWMVLCARARPGTAALLPAVVHVDGTARLQLVDAGVDPLMGAILDGMRRRKGLAALVNTSLNVGEPIAHTAKDVVRTLFRAKDLHCVVLVGEDGRGWVVACAPGAGPASSSLTR
jgi:carbamoyltransferase